MKIRLPGLLFVVALLFGMHILSGAQRFPPPEFESGHELPSPTTPAPRGELGEYLDMGVLLAALILSSYLTLKKRSRHGIFGLLIFCLIYFGFYREGCVCPIGSIQNVTRAIFDSTYVLSLSVLTFFLQPIIFTIFFGRGFCAAVCPLGAVQDVVLFHPIKVPAWLEHTLGLLGYVYLGAAVLFAATGSAFLICRYDPFVSFFRLQGSLDVVILGISFLLIGLFVGRPYCRFLCPYGIVLRWFSRMSKWRITITPDTCPQCHLCAESCPFGAIRRPRPAIAAEHIAGGKRRLALMLLLCPILTAGSGVLGYQFAETFSRMHPAVRLADQLHLEDAGVALENTDAVEAFRVAGKPVAEANAQALALVSQFRTGCWLFGAFVGLVIGLKLVQLSVFRSHSDYQADRGRCLACARCYEYCPVEHERLHQIRTEKANAE